MKVSTLLGFAGVALAQRPADTPMCDYYTKALLKDNTAKNQGTVLTLLVNTVVLGKDMPKPKIDGVNFPDVDGLTGILDPNATYMGHSGLIAPYFTGALDSTNRNNKPTSVNFLDDGGATPLIAGKAANGMSSHQYTLLTHLYEFFGTLLNCTQQGMSSDFAKYDGNPSMYDVHKYMALNSSQFGFFVTQVGLAAKSFGVTDDDVTAVGMALNTVFGQRCSPAIALAGATNLQSICNTADCAEADSPACDKYDTVMEPAVANMTAAMGLGSGSGSPAAASGASGTMSGSMATGSSMSGGSMSGGSSGGSSGGAASSSSAGAAAPTQAAGILAAGGMAAAAFFL